MFSTKLGETISMRVTS